MSGITSLRRFRPTSRVAQHRDWSRSPRERVPPLEVTDVVFETTDNVVGTLPRNALAMGRISSNGDSVSGPLYSDAPRLFFFKRVAGAPVAAISTYRAEKGVFSFPRPDVNDVENVPEDQLAAVVDQYRNRVGGCPELARSDSTVEDGGVAVNITPLDAGR